MSPCVGWGEGRHGGCFEVNKIILPGRQLSGSLRAVTTFAKRQFAKKAIFKSERRKHSGMMRLLEVMKSMRDAAPASDQWWKGRWTDKVRTGEYGTGGRGCFGVTSSGMLLLFKYWAGINLWSFIIPFGRWGKRGSEKLGNLLKGNQKVNGKTSLQ